MSLTRSHENQISNNIAPTVVFNGFGEDAISLPRNSLTSLFSTDLLDASSEGLHTPLTQSHFPSSRDEALQHGPEVDSESSSHRGWLQIPSPPDTVLESTVYRSIGSAFSWAQCEASVLSTDGMASASFQGLEPTQYDLVDCDVTELETSTLQLYSPIILDELLNECYNDPTGVRNFISLDRLKEMLQSVLRNNSNSSVKKALVYSAIAISFHLRNETQGQKNDSESFFRLSLVALTGVLLAKDTLLKLQSLIVVALDEGRIEFDVPECLSASNSRAADRTDYLLLQVQYAKLCSLTQKALYSPNVVSTPLATLDTATEFLHQQVDAWVSQLPPHLWSRGIPARERGHERRLFLQLHLQYYEVLLALDSRWLYPPSTFSKAPDQQRSQACKRCVSTAKMILESYESVRVADFLVNRQVPWRSPHIAAFRRS
ncbi:hypothetical protein MMC27_008801 [Xylographa pallens]|nr:hypothetical protein [Xylographa pallens]